LGRNIGNSWLWKDVPCVAVRAGRVGRGGRSLKMMVFMLAKFEGDLVFDPRCCCCKEVSFLTETNLSPMGTTPDLFT